MLLSRAQAESELQAIENALETEGDYTPEEKALLQRFVSCSYTHLEFMRYLVVWAKVRELLGLPDNGDDDEDDDD